MSWLVLDYILPSSYWNRVFRVGTSVNCVIDKVKDKRKYSWNCVVDDGAHK